LSNVVTEERKKYIYIRTVRARKREREEKKNRNYMNNLLDIEETIKAVGES
jgi:hypothetical protein